MSIFTKSKAGTPAWRATSCRKAGYKGIEERGFWRMGVDRWERFTQTTHNQLCVVVAWVACSAHQALLQAGRQSCWQAAGHAFRRMHACRTACVARGANTAEGSAGALTATEYAGMPGWPSSASWNTCTPQQRTRGSGLHAAGITCGRQPSKVGRAC